MVPPLDNKYYILSEQGVTNLVYHYKIEPIGLWGKRHARHLKEHYKVLYMNLLTSGKLHSYLAEVDKQAEDMFLRLVKEYADRQDVTEQLKKDNPYEWIGRMNNIQACVREVVGTELIYT